MIFCFKIQMGIAGVPSGRRCASTTNKGEGVIFLLGTGSGGLDLIVIGETGKSGSCLIVFKTLKKQ